MQTFPVITISDAHHIIRHYRLDRFRWGGCGSTEGFANRLFIAGGPGLSVSDVALALQDYIRDVALAANMGTSLDAVLAINMTDIVHGIDSYAGDRVELAALIRATRFQAGGAHVWNAVVELATTPNPTLRAVVLQDWLLPQLQSFLTELRRFKVAFQDSMRLYEAGRDAILDEMVRSDIHRFDSTLETAPPWDGSEPDTYFEAGALLCLSEHNDRLFAEIERRLTGGSHNRRRRSHRKPVPRPRRPRRGMVSSPLGLRPPVPQFAPTHAAGITYRIRFRKDAQDIVNGSQSVHGAFADVLEPDKFANWLLFNRTEIDPGMLPQCLRAYRNERVSCQRRGRVLDKLLSPSEELEFEDGIRRCVVHELVARRVEELRFAKGGLEALDYLLDLSWRGSASRVVSYDAAQTLRSFVSDTRAHVARIPPYLIERFCRLSNVRFRRGNLDTSSNAVERLLRRTELGQTGTDEGEAAARFFVVLCEPGRFSIC